MLARYLGNKTSILGPLVHTIQQEASPGAHVVDAFSGSLAVSMGLKTHGMRVTANDINLFSAVFADAYLIPSEPPSCDLAAMLPRRRMAEVRDLAKAQAEVLIGMRGFDFLVDPDWRRQYVDYLGLLQHLSTMETRDLPTADRRSHIFDTYCEEGEHSAFVSSRGTEGRRRFFSPANAVRMDLVLNQLRHWHRQGTIGAHAHALAIAGLVRAAEGVANTQGTFHDFIRSRWDSRALNPIRFEPPPLDDVVAGVGGHASGRERDTLDFIGEVDDHAVLYLDFPYNFRQYIVYYFLPNVLCRYSYMPDPEEYFAGVTYVRGQNPDDDFTSTFCKASRFIEDMRTLIQRARCETVVVSYFTGANHWGQFDSGQNDIGRDRLSDLLAEELFEPGSQRVIEVPRRNYASYGGFTAQAVTELLLVAKKRQDVVRETGHRSEGRLQPVA